MEDSITLYLLGQLSEGERADVERRLFVESGFLESLQIAEEELIRDELAGELPLDQRISFYSYFLSFPELREKYEFTRALRDASPRVTLLDQSKVESISGRHIRSGTRVTSRFAKRGPILLATAACAAFFFAGIDDLRRWSASSPSRAATHALAVPSFVLTPGLVRSGSSRQTRFSVPVGAALIRIRLEFERSEQYKTYQIALKAADSEQAILSMAGLEARPDGASQKIDLELPGSVVGENSYVLVLSGEAAGVSAPVEAYTFEIIRPGEK
jgi:hypothetical protein